jgi:AraC-like DNA-binding protein
MEADNLRIPPEKVHFRDVVINGAVSRRVAYPIRIGVETRNRPGYGQRGATRTIDDPCCIFQYTLAGQGLFIDDQGEHPLPMGTGFLCESHDPRIAYRFPSGGEQSWEFLYMSFNADPLAALVKEFGERMGRVVTLPMELPVLNQIQRLLRAKDSLLFMPAGEAAVLVMDLLSAFAGFVTGGQETAEDLTIKQIQTLIHKRLQEGRIDLIELAEELGMSRGNLCRFYRAQTGMSPYQYILRKQMLLACQWLLEEHLTVKETAARLGFSTPANFIRSFKKVTGMTTRQFLKQGLLPRL